MSLLTTNCAKKSFRPQTWLCYYGSTLGPEFYSGFDLVVLDGHSHPPLKKTGKNHPILLGYLSVGEVDVDGPFWEFAKGKSYLIKKNEFWDSWIVDIRDPEWQQLIFKTAIPYILNQGFDGFFLDTIDSSLSLLEGKEKKNFRGIKKSIQEIIRKIKENNPNKFIAVNRGLSYLPEFAKFIDFVIIEDFFSLYSEEEKNYAKVAPDIRGILVEQVKRGLQVNPQLNILTLDYAANEQTDLAREAISYSRKEGFIPYVSTKKLDQIFFYTLGN